MQRSKDSIIKESDINIRLGDFKDLNAVLELVNELAVYEKEPDAVTASLEEYQDLFRDHWYNFYVAEYQQSIIGIAIFYRTFSTWKGRMLYLEDLVVSLPFRGKGIGKMLFQATVDHARAEKCALLKWQVLDWNEPAIRFYESLDAIIEKEWLNGKLILDPSKY